MPIIDREQCTGFAVCVELCPTNALDLVNEQAALVDPTACSYCRICEEFCPEGAIALPYQIMPAQPIAKQRDRNDRPHTDESNPSADRPSSESDGTQ